MSVSPHIEVPFGMEKQDIVGDHVERVRTSVLVRHTAATIANWITRNTFYAGTPYSFHAHEYQEKILSDTSRDVSIRKCSQVGLSECSARNALGLVNVLSPYTVCYTLPTAKFAATFMKTRVDPVINASKVMKGNLNGDNDNNEVKQFGDSWLYMRGAASSNAPISIPVDHLIHDEVDFSDQEVLGQYHSRLTHSPWKRSTRLSTPTLPKFGIDLSFQESRRHFNLCRCNYCNHFFIPDYYEHVRIPGFKEDLRTIRKQTLPKIRWEEAYVACPKCGKSPSLLPEHRHWVCENPTEKYIGAGYQVTPFDAPLIILPSSLVEASTKYDRIQDFVNFNLGLPMEDSEATMSREDFGGVFVVGEAPSIGQMVMSADLGNLCHMAVGKVMTNDDILVVHTEIVPIGRFKQRYRELRKEWRPVCTVTDSAPNAETIMSLQTEDPSLFASVYMRSKSLVTHQVVEKDEEAKKGVSFQRQVNVNRSRAFDAYMEFVRGGHLQVLDSDNKELIITHHTSMKRVKVYDHESGEMQYSWQKSDGNDHFHHCFIYLYIASKIRGIGRPTVLLPLGMMSTFTVKKSVFGGSSG